MDPNLYEQRYIGSESIYCRLNESLVDWLIHSQHWIKHNWIDNPEGRKSKTANNLFQACSLMLWTITRDKETNAYLTTHKGEAVNCMAGSAFSMFSEKTAPEGFTFNAQQAKGILKHLYTEHEDPWNLKAKWSPLYIYERTKQGSKNPYTYALRDTHLLSKEERQLLKTQGKESEYHSSGTECTRDSKHESKSLSGTKCCSSGTECCSSGTESPDIPYTLYPTMLNIKEDVKNKEVVFNALSQLTDSENARALSDEEPEMIITFLKNLRASQEEIKHAFRNAHRKFEQSQEERLEEDRCKYPNEIVLDHDIPF